MKSVKSRQAGQIAVEYVLAVTVCALVIVIGAPGEPGVATLWLDSLRHVHADYSAVLADLDAIP